MKKYLLLMVIAVICLTALQANSQITAMSIPPSSSTAKDGQIEISGLKETSTYTVTYTVDAAPVRTSVTAAKGVVVIDKLPCGIYANIVLYEGGKATNVTGSFNLGRVADQAIKFLAAGYANFTGVQDDDPKNFAQVYARLSQPFNRDEGINYDATWGQRIIPLRNIYFQLTYGNTDNFKTYSFDTLNAKFVNRLDMLAHSYLNANLEINLLTFILPQRWKNHTGDMAHIYLSAMSALLSTNVTDTLKADKPSTTKTYNVHSWLAGLDLTAIFKDVWGSKFTIELGPKMFYILPASSTINPRLNPQNNNVTDIYNAQNASKNFLREKPSPYLKFDALIQYNTGTGKNDNNSNIFLHYSYTSNFANVFGKNYANNYFQFQLGYAMDVTKIFKPASADK